MRDQAIDMFDPTVVLFIIVIFVLFFNFLSCYRMVVCSLTDMGLNDLETIRIQNAADTKSSV